MTAGIREVEEGLITIEIVTFKGKVTKPNLSSLQAALSHYGRVDGNKVTVHSGKAGDAMRVILSFHAFPNPWPDAGESEKSCEE
jgi:hypothetical protein